MIGRIATGRKGIQAMQTGKALLNNIRACSLREGECAIWWMGQAGVIVKLGRAVIGIDLFLSAHPRRRVQPLLTPNEIANFDLLLGTHDHIDHIDRPAWPAISKSSPNAMFIVPDFLLPGLANDLRLSPERFIGLDDGVFAEVNGVCVTGVAAAHELLDRDPATGRYPYLGYIIEANGFRLFHAGDGCVYEGLQTNLNRWRLDLAMLPINGRDAVRLAANCIGNMTYQEAADLAGALGPGTTIPLHYDMFTHNAENPQLFTDYMRVKYPRLKKNICRHGARLILRAAN
jgi:L-ascorbate metabolism protein UlaG (beta-lactamase superfamily)